MKSWKAIVGVVLIFLAGVAVGAAGGTWFAFHRMPKPGPDMLVWVLEREVMPQLDLSPAQEVEFRKVCDQTRAELLLLHRDIRPQFDEILERTDGRIRLLLDEEQRIRLDRIREEFKRNHPKELD